MDEVTKWFNKAEELQNQVGALQAKNAKLKEMKSITNAIQCPNDECCGTLISTVQIGMARCNECNELWHLSKP